MSLHSVCVEEITETAQSSPPSLKTASQGSGVDSGYSSAAVTPKSLDKVLDRSRFDSTRSSNPFRLLYPSKGTDDLKQFEKNIDKATMDRYEDVRERLEVALAKYMQKSPQNYKPMAIRLVVLGTTEEDAKAWIVVLCPYHRVKRVQRFFSKPLARDLCQPQDPDIPSFPFTVVGQPLQTRAGSEIQVHGRTNDSKAAHTLCGTLVKLSDGNQTRIGTLGGIVKVTNGDGQPTFYGMTAGHLIEDMANAGNNIDADELLYDSAEEGSDWNSSDESDYTSDFSESLPRSGRRSGKQLLDAFESTSLPAGMESANEWKRIGNVLTASSSSSSSSGTNRTSPNTANLGYRDWALVELDNESDLRPNTLRDGTEGVQKHQFADLQVSSTEDLKMTGPLHVVMASGLQGVKRGTLSPLPCSVLLGRGRRFVRAYTLKLWDGEDIRQGDSGSWVIDSATLQVHGHVIASDMFGDAYVIPIHEILADVKHQLNAASVQLLSSLDVACVRLKNQPASPSTPVEAQSHLKASPAPVTPPDFSHYYSLFPKAPEYEFTFGDSGYSSLDTSPVPFNTLQKRVKAQKALDEQPQHVRFEHNGAGGLTLDLPRAGPDHWACCKCASMNGLSPLSRNRCTCEHNLCIDCRLNPPHRKEKDPVAPGAVKRAAPSTSDSGTARASKRTKLMVDEGDARDDSTGQVI